MQKTKTRKRKHCAGVPRTCSYHFSFYERLVRLEERAKNFASKAHVAKLEGKVDVLIALNLASIGLYLALRFL